jgi:hypothetical protein
MFFIGSGAITAKIQVLKSLGSFKRQNMLTYLRSQAVVQCQSYHCLLGPFCYEWSTVLE